MALHLNKFNAKWSAEVKKQRTKNITLRTEKPKQRKQSHQESSLHQYELHTAAHLHFKRIAIELETESTWKNKKLRKKKNGEIVGPNLKSEREKEK